MNMIRLSRYAITLLLVCISAPLHAELKLPSVFGKDMVLQRDLPVPVWGWANAGEEVSVEFSGQTKTTKSDQDGKWMVKLDALEACAEGQTLSVTSDGKIELSGVLVGEVWICSGQSNMEWRLASSLNGKEEAAAANHETIRLFNVPGHLTSPTPLDHCPGTWAKCETASANGFSAVGYFFGRRLNKELGVPIGLIGSNWGGTRIEPWTSLDGFRSVEELSDLAEKAGKISEGKIGGGTPTAIYNAMVHPLAPLAMRGAIWYQGESNGGEGVSYYHKKKALVNGWRKVFQNPDLAFYWVQLANFRAPNDKPEGGDGWAKIREAQRKALEIPHTGMAVITDIGEAGDIHPRNKQDVGWRLSQWALHQTYDKKDLVPAGPLFKCQKIEDASIRLSFDHVGSGLMVGKKEGLQPTAKVADGKLAHFAIAGEDKKWFWAEATIDGETVVVKSSDVPKPVAVRYGYTINPATANLYNKEGIPASPFRTDDW